jgi:diketogulonate reductase-like aldo/keto reductase
MAISRRSFVGSLGGLGLGLAAGQAQQLGAGIPAAAAAPPTAPPTADAIMKTIPRTSEKVPAIGLGSFLTFDLLPGKPRGHIREIVRRVWDGGGRVLDTSPLYGLAEVNVGAALAALDIGDKLFLTNKIWSTGEFLADASFAEHSLAQTQARLWRERIDVMQCHSLTNVDVVVPLLHAWKKEGKIRFVGATHHDPAYFDILAGWITKGNLDFVQVHYSIANRSAEDRVLRAAADHGTAVLVNMPLEKARLHKIVDGRPLPDFARELGARTWAQFFLKYVISHPAITCALPATSNPEHAADNIAALRGPLPDANLRARMVKHMESIPGFDKLDQMPWYPDKHYAGVIDRAQTSLKERT